MKKRLLSLFLAIAMLLSVFPTNIFAQKDKKSIPNGALAKLADNAEIVRLPNGFLIKPKGFTPSRATRRPYTEDDIGFDAVKVDFSEIMRETGLDISQAIVTIYAGATIDYEKSYIFQKKTSPTEVLPEGVYPLGEAEYIDIPNQEFIPLVKVELIDGRNMQQGLEFQRGGDGVTVNVGVAAHTGVEVRWFGDKANRPAQAPPVQFWAKNSVGTKFNFPLENQNLILRFGGNLTWRGHDNIVQQQLLRDNIIESSTKSILQKYSIAFDDNEYNRLGTAHKEGTLQGQNGKEFLYKIIGNGMVGQNITLRQKVKVNFDENGGTWKTEKPAEQITGHSLALGDTEFSRYHYLYPELQRKLVYTSDWKNNQSRENIVHSDKPEDALSEDFIKDFPDEVGHHSAITQPITVPDGAKALTPPAADKGKPANEFKGWVLEADKDGDYQALKDANKIIYPSDMAKQVITDDTTFYAIYGPVAQGYAKVQFWDKTNNEEITNTNLRLDDASKYANQISGTKDSIIDMFPFTTGGGYKAPRFVGYTYANPEVSGQTGQDQKYHYTDPVTATLKLNYTTIEDVIAADPTKGGKDQPDGYVKVTFHGDKEAEKRGQLYKADDKALVDEIVYYVNPYKGIKLNDAKLVANIKANDGYKVNTAQQWNDANNTLDRLDVPITNAQASYDLYAQYTETTANQFKNKLKAEPIKVWKDETITWKKGVALKAEDAQLKAILDADTTKVTDLGTDGTVDAPKAERTAAAANLPNGTKGNLKVTFEDGSYVVVKDQVLYVAEHKNETDDPNLPANKLTVNFVIGEGVDGTAKTFYIKPNTSLDKDTDLPTIKAKDGYKDAKWYKGEANSTTEAKDADYTNIAESVTFTAKATQKGKGTAALKFVDTNNGDITLDEKTKIDGQKYTAAEIAVPNSTDKVNSRKDGADVVFTKDMAPQIRGYKLANDNQTPIAKSAEKYSETTPVTITLKYEKVADIVPAGPGVEKPAGYEDVTFANKEGAKLAGDSKKDAKVVYYVNPKAGTKVQLDGGTYQLIGKDKDNQELKIPVPTVESADAAKYEVTYADGSNNKWAYNKFDQVNQDITKAVTFTAQVVKIGEPTVTYPGIDFEKDKVGKEEQEKSVTPQVTNKYGKTPTVIPTPSVTPADNPNLPDGVVVTPDTNGKITVKIPKDYKGPDEFTVKVKVQVDGKDIPAEIKVTLKQPAPVPERPKDDGYITVVPVTPEPKPDPKTGVHNIYIYGYEDKTVHPQGNMTRAEAAAMVARLKGLDMSDDSKPAFNDVESGWYNAAIHATTKAGLMKGYPDGSFKPNGKITRAEFAQLIKGIDAVNRADVPFTDVQGHWGLAAIEQAFANKRINGYPDNTFKPNNPITRAEAVTVLNNLFDREVNEAGLANVRGDIVEFNDLNRSHWAYYEIVEASNTHEYYRAKDGGVTEVWTRVLKSWNDFLGK